MSSFPKKCTGVMNESASKIQFRKVKNNLSHKYWHFANQTCCAQNFFHVINFNSQGHGSNPNED